MAPLEKWFSAERVEVPQGAVLGPFSDGSPRALPRRGSISSQLLISKAHYFVLRLAVCQSSVAPAAVPPWPFTKPIIYFGEFLRYCFVRANQGWVTNDPSRVVGSPSVSGTRGQTHFWKFHVNYSRPWLAGESGLGWRKGGGGQTGVMAPLPPSLGWGHNTNKCPRAKIRHDATFDWCIELRLRHEKQKISST